MNFLCFLLSRRVGNATFKKMAAKSSKRLEEISHFLVASSGHGGENELTEI
jgi:hypothetical protein